MKAPGRRGALLALGIAVLAAGLVVAGALTWAGGRLASSAAPTACSPAPCAAPHGMELHVDQVTVVNHGAGRRLVLTIHYANHTRPQLAEATGSRHTGLADLQLREDGGRRDRPVFGDGCPKWDDLTLPRGQVSGEQTACFDLTGPPRQAASLDWSPDLGPLFQSVTLDLGDLPG